MADRRSLISRFWPPSGTRRSTPTQTTAPPPATPNTAPPSSPSRRPTTTTRAANPATTPPSTPNRRPPTTNQPATDHQTAGQPRKSPSIQTQPITSSNPIDEPKTSTNPKDEPKTSPSSTNPKDEPKTVSPSSTNPKGDPKTSPSSTNPIDDPKTSPSSKNPIDDPKTISPSSTNPIDEPKTSPSSINPIDEPKTSSPSRETTQSSSPSKPSSPNHRLAKSRSPPQPSYPAPQAQNTGSQTPKRASHPRLKSSSPKVGPSSSPKRTQPKSPSKESRQPSQEFSSYEKDPKPATSQQEHQLNADVETDSANGKTLDRTSFKHDELGQTPYPSSEVGTAKPKEAEDVKEVVQATNAEANEETKKKNSGSEDQIIEKTEILSKPDQVQTEETSGVTPVHKQVADGDPKGDTSDKHVSVILLAGENRGASMQVHSNSSKQEGSVHIHRSYKINPDESPEATTDGEGSSDQKKTEDANSRDDQPTETYVNNNAQGINNSIVFNSSITEGSPGVHMVVTHLPKELIQSTNNGETRKAEFNTTRTEKLTYQPTVRRRCLKGLFLETSDSDPENPEKPRSHGCQVGCEKRDKEDNVDVL